MLPLPTLLSQVLVAYTIEFDNEAEHRLPHRTTDQGGSLHAPWLVSMAMWWNCMRFVGEHGVRIGELEDLALTKTNLDGMRRWGYIVVEPPPARTGRKPPQSDWLIRATPAGRKAREIWQALFDVIDKRWQVRFGEDLIDQLQTSLSAVMKQFDVELPDCLPILGYGLFSRASERKRKAANEDAADNLRLPALLSRVLLAVAIEFERESEFSLAISANVLRVLAEREATPVREVSVLSGVSKEAISMALGFLQKKGAAVVEQDPAAKRTKVVRLTPKGRRAHSGYIELLEIIEERWRTCFGRDRIRVLRDLLERMLPRLSLGLEPYPGGWRASVPKPTTLPHYPMVLHRGGFPDGS